MDTETGLLGLSESEAAARLKQFGANSLPENKPQAAWRRFARQFKSPLIYILLFALAVDLGLWIKEGMHGFPFESVVIGTILLLNAGMGVWQEAKAEAALSRLKALATPQAWVLRGAV